MSTTIAGHEIPSDISVSVSAASGDQVELQFSHRSSTNAWQQSVVTDLSGLEKATRQLLQSAAVRK